MKASLALKAQMEVAMGSITFCSLVLDSWAKHLGPKSLIAMILASFMGETEKKKQEAKKSTDGWEKDKQN